MEAKTKRYALSQEIDPLAQETPSEGLGKEEYND